MKVVRPVIASNGVPYFKMRLVGSHGTSGMEKEEREKRTGGEGIMSATSGE